MKKHYKSVNPSQSLSHVSLVIEYLSPLFTFQLMREMYERGIENHLVERELKFDGFLSKFSYNLNVTMSVAPEGAHVGGLAPDVL